MEDSGIFYCHLVNFPTIWSIVLPFGQFSSHLVYFMALWYIFVVIWYIFPVLVYLATLLQRPEASSYKR
jgi:hypothetical protein